jgi:hypothetical protein
MTESVLLEILEREMEMFLSVPTDGPCGCKDHLDSFLLNRRVQFLTWSEEALSSYRDDLVSAKRDGRNLMTYKYARMGGQLPCENTDPLIDAIVCEQMEWQGALFKTYPAFMCRARPLRTSQDGDGKTSFETYLRAELETFSAATLARLLREIERKKTAGINMSEETYELLLKEKGLPPLAEMERRMGTA